MELRDRHGSVALSGSVQAGIRIEAYQMGPLRNALRPPRVNLFIADDTGHGKTMTE